MVAMRDSSGMAITVGHFAGCDPLGFEAGDNNWYRFVANGPTEKMDPNGLAWSDCMPGIRERNGMVCGYSILILTGACCALPEVVLAATNAYTTFVDCWWTCEKEIHAAGCGVLPAVGASAGALGSPAVRLLKPEGAPRLGKDFTTVARSVGRAVGGESSRAASIGKLAGRSRIAVAAKITFVAFVVVEAGVSWHCSARCS